MKNNLIFCLLTLGFLITSWNAIAQNPYQEKTTSYFLRIKPKLYENREIVGFELFNKAKRNQTSWISPVLKPLEKDSLGYLVKVDIPQSLISQIKMMHCTALSIGGEGLETDTVEFSYGGVRLSPIRLNIASDPPGAEVYLVPNRVWLADLQNKKWQDDLSLLSDFRVSTSLTQTYTYIDQTVYRVIFRLGDQFQNITHFTRPPAIEKEQKISVQF